MSNKKMSNKNEVKTIEVCSADKRYLIVGVIFTILVVILECLAIREFFVDDLVEATFSFFLLQIEVMLCLLQAYFLKLYMQRKNFNIYYCEFKNGIDINDIKENYEIEFIDLKQIVFVDKENSEFFSSWKMMNGYKLNENETEFF